MAAQPDPWTLARDYLEMLNAASERDARAAYGFQTGIMESRTRRAEAEILAQGQAQTATTLFERQLQRDEATREHQVGIERMKLDAKGTGPGSRLRPSRGGVGGAAPAGGGGGGGGGDVASYAYNRYVQQGINPIVAAGIVGNLDVESGWDDAVINGTRRGDNGTAAYIAQWRGSRQANLVAFAQQRGNDRPTLDDQLDFIIYEGENGLDAGARSALQKASQSRTPEEAAEHFMLDYERPSKDPSVNHVARRKAAAAAVHGGTGGGAGYQGPDIADPYSISGGGARRYGVESGAGQVAGVAPTTAPTSQASFDPSQVGNDYVWTDDDKRSFLNASELGMLPPDMDIVGPGAFYTGEQLQALGPSSQYLFPVGKAGPDEAAGYLQMAPRGQQAQMGGNNPNTGAAAPAPPETVTAPQVSPGIEAPPIEMQPAPTAQPSTITPFPGVGPTGGQRVRQNPNTGGFEMFDGSQWLPLSG